MKSISKRIKAIVAAAAVFVVVTVTSTVMVVLQANGVFETEPEVTIKAKNEYSRTLNVATELNPV